MGCGASSGQKTTAAGESSLFNTLTQQAQSEFGMGDRVFSDLYSALAPIEAAGPSQQGESAAEKQAIDSATITNEGIAARNAEAATGNALAAEGGGNNILPSGTTAGIKANTAIKFAEDTAAGLNANLIQDYNIGRENFWAADKALAGAPSVFNTANSAGNAATGAGSAAMQGQTDIAQANNSWMNAAFGALGEVGGAVVSGGMSNLGKGEGFFGG